LAGKDDIRRDLLNERRRRASEGYGSPAAVWTRLEGLPCWPQARSVAAYLATAGEVSLDGLIESLLRAGRTVWLPRFSRAVGQYEMVRTTSLSDGLVPGAFGIREPRAVLAAVPAEELPDRGVLWLVPGVGFDPAGHRLGRGRGYYDRLLRGARGARVGIAWDWQVVDEVPHADHDEPVQWIVTDSRTIACGGPAA